MVDKKQLQSWLDEGKSQRQMASLARVAQTTIRKWLCQYDLGSCAKTHKCKCGETDPLNFQSGRFSECRRCRTKRQIQLYLTYKLEAIEYKGGKCSLCGYARCSAALDFHHEDPVLKDPDWGKMRHRSFDSIKAELDKCVLVCKNCHTEIHYMQRESGSR